MLQLNAAVLCFSFMSQAMMYHAYYDASSSMICDHAQHDVFAQYIIVHSFADNLQRFPPSLGPLVIFELKWFVV